METPRTPRTKEEVVKDFRTAEILDAARRVITELGYEGASMERIAQEAGVAKGTIYLYFKNKEALLGAAFEQGFEQLMRRTRELTEAAASYREGVRGVVRAFLEYSGENFPFWRALQGRPDLTPEGDSPISALFRKQIEAYEQYVSAMLERGMHGGEFRRADAARCGRFLTDMMRGVVVAQLRHPRDYDVDEEIAAVVDFFLHGLARAQA